MFLSVFVLFFSIFGSFTVHAMVAGESCTSNEDCEARLNLRCKILSTGDGVCQGSSEDFCKSDKDCFSLGASKCLEAKNSSILFSGDTDADYGVCGEIISSEENPLGDSVCRLIKLFTDGIAKGVVAIAIIVLGVMFFMGKIPWTTVIAIVAGCGAIFGAPAIVGVITGKKMMCR